MSNLTRLEQSCSNSYVSFSKAATGLHLLVKGLRHLGTSEKKEHLDPVMPVVTAGKCFDDI